MNAHSASDAKKEIIILYPSDTRDAAVDGEGEAAFAEPLSAGAAKVL